MKKALSLLLSAAMLAAVTVTAAFGAEATYKGKTVVLYTGNVRGDETVYPQIQKVKEDYEAKGAEVLLVDAGNYLQGSAAANASRGKAVYELMNAAGYDVAAMGLSEFGYIDATTGYVYHGNVTRYYTQAMLQKGTGEVTYNKNRDGSQTGTLAAREGAKFQTVASNVTALKEDVYAFEPSVSLTTESGLKVTFWGCTDPAVAENVQDGYVAVAEDLPTADTEADVNIVLCNAPWTGTDDNVIVAPTGGALTAGVLVIDNKTHAITREEVALTPAAKTSEGIIGTSQVILNGADSVNWNGESNLGDLTTDALAWYAANYIDGIDKTLPIVAIQNGGNCDNFLYTGEITEADLLKALPFSPMGIGVLQVTGEELLETIEASTQKESCPGFAQVSGLTYILNTTKDYDGGEAYGNFFVADSINRVTITSVNGAPFDPAATYNLVCDNFLMNGNDTYYTLKNIKEAEGAKYVNNGNGVKTRDAVALYIQQVLNGVVGEAYAAPQGRITKVSFSDVPADSYCFRAVDWAVEKGITTGTGDAAFTPDRTCTDAEILTFLWRSAGSPEPAAAVGDTYYYTKSTAWAAEQGITENQGDPDLPCTRATAVTYLWRAAGSPKAAGTVSFTDVPTDASYAQAVTWAVAEGITTGTSDTAFTPDRTCTRGEIVTLLYRWLVK